MLTPGEKNIMSVNIPTFAYQTRTADENDIYSYGFAFTSSDLDGAVKSLADILPDMIRLAECEKACQLMAAEIEKTRRRVNALEHVIIPEAEENIKYITMKLDENDIYSYGFAFTSSDLDGAVKSLADILPDMIRLAECEKACQLMAAEIEKTRRRVNALEHVIIPEAEENIKYITMKLDENERSTQIRLMKVKDMMLEDAHHYKEKMQE